MVRTTFSRVGELFLIFEEATYGRIVELYCMDISTVLQPCTNSTVQYFQQII